LWYDELAKYRYAREAWDQGQFGLRLGKKPRTLITTTPKPIELIKAIHAGYEGKVHVTVGHTKDNTANLAKSFVEKIYLKYEGTRLGRQELAGEILGDVKGALWRLSDIDLYRHKVKFDEFGLKIKSLPDMQRVLVAVDPATTSSEGSNEHGIVVAGIASGEGYVLEDGSISGQPLEWAQRAIALHDKYAADGVVVEVNQGGEMCKSTLQSVRPNLNVIMVRASRGKHVRAEPVSALYAQGRIHHVGCFAELEQQMIHMTNEGYVGLESPDRCDALVWCITALFPDLIAEEAVQIPTFKKRSIV
jgi:phage terminase large subunit-like protein